LDDGATSDFEATLVLATMTVSQLSDSNDAQQPATSAQHTGEPRAAATQVPENVSNHTKIWSELSGVYLSCEMLFPSNHWYGCTTCMPSYPLSNWTSLWSDQNQGRTKGPMQSIMAIFGNWHCQYQTTMNGRLYALV
jgi:hypothetical protein